MTFLRLRNDLYAPEGEYDMELIAKSTVVD